DEVASIWANQEFDWLRYSARFEYDLLNQHKLASLNLSHKPLEYNFPKQAVISANAIATGIWNDQSGISANLGGRIHADSGTLLGNYWNVGADYTRFQPLPSLLAEDTKTDVQASNFISVYSKYRISRNFELGTIYSNDFGQDHTFRLSLSGHISINPPRRYKKTLEGKGILKGRLFLDNNGDGLFQTNEKPLAGVVLNIEGTNLALRTDADGYYTIANLPTGSFRISVDERQLPLGLIRESAYIRYATVGDGQITEYDIPMIKSGQIRGRVFVDSNDNGKLDKGEEGLEGVTIQLSPGELTTVSSAFGQYAFDELSPGEYQVKIVDSGLVQRSITTTKGSDKVIVDTVDKSLLKVDIPVKSSQ
ncbi:MAG: SdrD B-like domain-containing protein, partial [Methylococcales bacterium]